MAARNYGLLTRGGLLLIPSFPLFRAPFPFLLDLLGPLLQDVFNEAAERVKQLKEASNADRLCLYGYFKQSTIGDVNIRTFRSLLVVLLLCVLARCCFRVVWLRLFAHDLFCGQ